MHSTEAGSTSATDKMKINSGRNVGDEQGQARFTPITVSDPTLGASYGTLDDGNTNSRGIDIPNTATSFAQRPSEPTDSRSIASKDGNLSPYPSQVPIQPNPLIANVRVRDVETSQIPAPQATVRILGHPLERYGRLDMRHDPGNPLSDAFFLSLRQINQSKHDDNGGLARSSSTPATQPTASLNPLSTKQPASNKEYQATTAQVMIPETSLSSFNHAIELSLVAKGKLKEKRQAGTPDPAELAKIFKANGKRRKPNPIEVPASLPPTKRLQTVKIDIDWSPEQQAKAEAQNKVIMTQRKAEQKARNNHAVKESRIRRDKRIRDYAECLAEERAQRYYWQNRASELGADPLGWSNIDEEERDDLIADHRMDYENFRDTNEPRYVDGAEPT